MFVATCYTLLLHRKWLGVRDLYGRVCWSLGLTGLGLRGW